MSNIPKRKKRKGDNNFETDRSKNQSNWKKIRKIHRKRPGDTREGETRRFIFKKVKRKFRGKNMLNEEES